MCLFFILSHVFSHLWDGQDCWSIASLPTFQFLSSQPPINLLEAHTNRIPLDAPLNYLYFFLANIIIGQPPGQLLHISYFLSFQEGINIRQQQTLTAASQDLSTKKEEEMDEQVISIEGECDSPSSSGLWGGPLQLVTGPWILWWVFPSSMRNEDNISPSW